MDAATLAALDASIEHWRKNSEAEKPEDVSTGIFSCALCLLFYYRGCKGCPVNDRTGVRLCSATPYMAAHEALKDWRRRDDNAVAFRDAARAELDFLISLRPSDAPALTSVDA